MYFGSVGDATGGIGVIVPCATLGQNLEKTVAQGNKTFNALFLLNSLS